MHAIDGIPRNCQILHVEQEVVGDDTSALQCVLNTDIERAQLLEEEAHLIAKQVRMLFFKSVEWGGGTIMDEVWGCSRRSMFWIVHKIHEFICITNYEVVNY